MRYLLSTLALIALAACGQPATTQPAETPAAPATEGTANVVQPSATETTATSISPELAARHAQIHSGNRAPSTVPELQPLFGRWGVNGDCTQDITFNRDGSFQSYNYGNGRWSSVAGDLINITAQPSAGSDALRANGVYMVRYTIRDGNELRLVDYNLDGTSPMLRRC